MVHHGRFQSLPEHDTPSTHTLHLSGLVQSHFRQKYKNNLLRKGRKGKGGFLRQLFLFIPQQPVLVVLVLGLSSPNMLCKG